MGSTVLRSPMRKALRPDRLYNYSSLKRAFFEEVNKFFRFSLKTYCRIHKNAVFQNMARYATSMPSYRRVLIIAALAASMREI